MLPSVSAAISYTPFTSFVWFVCIALHTPLRFILARRVYQTYKRIFAGVFEPENLARMSQEDVKYFALLRKLSFLAFQFNLAEVMGLLILSIFTSMTNFGNFVIFIFIFQKFESKLYNVSLNPK